MNSDQESPWHRIPSKRYVGLASVGILLILGAGLLWGRGWWVHVLLLAGWAVIILPSSNFRRRQDARSSS